MDQSTSEYSIFYARLNIDLMLIIRIGETRIFGGDLNLALFAIFIEIRP